MKIGYSYWGFLGDYKMDENGNELSTPDGNATYSWSIIWEAQQRGHTVFSMQEDRDYPAWKRLKGENFSAFSREKRLSAYEGLRHTRGATFPELDVLLLEWRFPIHGRNVDVIKEDGHDRCLYDPFRHQPDWARQFQLLDHYKGKKTKIILWDLDHKLTENDEKHWLPDAIFETSHSPLRLFKERTRVEPPFHIPDLLQHPTFPSDVNRKMVYIGSRYERDDVIDEWVRPLSNTYPGQVEFHGKWDDDSKKKWPNIRMEPRCTVKDFWRIYSTAGSVPLLAKKSYLETGFITPRPWEAILFGSLPVGLGTAKGIDQYAEFVAHSPSDMLEIAELLAGSDFRTRDYFRRENAKKLEFMDAAHFVDKIEAVVR